MLQKVLRKSDIIMQNRTGRFFVFLPELSEADVGSVLGRIMSVWKQTDYHDKVSFKYVMKGIDCSRGDE